MTYEEFNKECNEQVEAIMRNMKMNNIHNAYVYHVNPKKDYIFYVQISLEEPKEK